MWPDKLFLFALITVVSSIFIDIHFHGFIEIHSFKDMYIPGQWFYQYNVLLRIAIQWTFHFEYQLNKEINDYWRNHSNFPLFLLSLGPVEMYTGSWLPRVNGFPSLCIMLWGWGHNSPSFSSVITGLGGCSEESKEIFFYTDTKIN